MKFQWRKWFRVVHRDFGYLFFGLTLVYSVSGIALNHLDDWNSNYIIVRKEITVENPRKVTSKDYQAGSQGHPGGAGGELWL